jgi:putative endonuclease
VEQEIAGAKPVSHPMSYYVYIIQSLKTLKYYIGSTNNLERRLIEHNSGKSKFTRNKNPFSLIYKEEYPTRSEALKRELQIKSYKGGCGFKKLIDRSSVPPAAGRSRVRNPSATPTASDKTKVLSGV